MKKQLPISALASAIVVLLLFALAGGALAATNLALSAVATSPSGDAEYANDGLPFTAFYPGMPDAELQLSWGTTPQTFSGIVMRQQDGFNDIDSFEVQAYANGAWTTVPMTTTSDTAGNLIAMFAPVTATDVKVIFKSAIADYWTAVDISEIEVYNSNYSEPDLALPANGGTASVSGNADWGAGANGLNDGNVAPNWQCGWISPSGWWQIPTAQISWNSPVKFNQVTVRFGSCSASDGYYNWGAQAYRLQTSNDGVNWTDLKVGSSIRLSNSQNWAGQFNESVYGSAVLQVYLPAPINAKYIRVRPINYNDHSVIIQEIEVYNRVNPGWATITGKVRDAANPSLGVPAQLQIVAPTWNPAWQDLYNFDIDESGNYTLVVDPGDYNLDVRGPGYVTKQVPISVTANQQLTDFNIDLDHGAWADFPNATLSMTTPSGIPTDSGNGLFFDTWWGIVPVAATAGPDNRSCLKLSNTDSSWANCGLMVSQNFYAGSCDNAWLTITYLDNRRSGGFQFNQPRPSDPSGTCTPAAIQFEGTGQWVTRVVPFNMTYFSRLAWPYDCYISIAPGDTYISSMSLSFRKPANYGVLPIDITFDAGGRTENGLNQMFNTLDGWWSDPYTGYDRSHFETTPVVKGGKDATWLASGQILDLAADSSRYMGVHDVWITIEYFDEGNDTLGLDLEKTLAPSYREYTVTKTNTNTWKRWTLFIQNFSFNHFWGNDIWLWSGGTGTAIRQVSVSNTMPVDVADHKIGELKANTADGAYVTIGGKVVSYDYGPWSYWIEESDRSSGIQVGIRAGTAVPPVGAQVAVYGYMKTNDWSGKIIDDAQFVVVGAGDPIKPLAMNNKMAASLQGPDVNGLYVRLWGKVTDISDSTGKFTIDDGSGMPIVVDSWDRPWQPRTYVPGVDYVLVTGALTSAGTPTLHTWEAGIDKF